MFEGQVAFYLNKYLGQYLNGLDAESLRISVWRGDVELSNLSLKPEALADLDLPVTVKAGLLGKLTLKVPWKALGREPVVVEFDRLYILAGPKEQQSAQPCKTSVSEYEAEAAAAELEAKRRRVLAAEAAWVQELQAKLALKAAALKGQLQQAAAAARSEGGGGLFNLQALMHTVLGNLQLRLTNVHIRYEDALSLPGQLLAAGITLERVSAHTVDEAGRETFVTSGVLQLLRKAVVLQELGVYFDVGRPFLVPPRGDWAALVIYEWDALFLPARHAPGSSVHPHHFLVLPITGLMNYVRRSSKALAAAAAGSGGSAEGPLPKQEGRIALRSVSLALSRQQYVGSRALLETLDSYTANSPYRAIRPKVRPAEGEAARVWWRYAFLAVRKQLRGSRVAWAQLRTACLLRKAYVPAYVRCLEAAATGGGKGSGGGKGQAGAQPGVVTAGLGGDAAIAAMDAQLPESTILLFRRMAHAQLQLKQEGGGSGLPSRGASTTSSSAALQQQAPAGQLTAPAAAVAPAVPPAQDRTWIGWWRGTNKAAAAAAAAAPAATALPGGTAAGTGGSGPSGSDAGVVMGPSTATLSPEEWSRLQELLQQQEFADDDDDDEPGSGRDGPYSLRTLLEVAVERASLELRGELAAVGGVPGTDRPRPILLASMRGLGVRLLHYPVALALNVRLGWAGVEAPQGMLLCTGSLGAAEGQGLGLGGVGAAGAAGGPPVFGGVLGPGRSGPPTRTATPALPASTPGGPLKPTASTAVLAGAAPGVAPVPQAQTQTQAQALEALPCAFMVDFMKRPQDGSADAVVSVRLAPSYVTYNGAALRAVVAFFSSSQQLGIGTLQAQAAARAAQLQRLAALRLKALSAERPRLAVAVVMHAPKVALPDSKGRATLLLDLGCFSLRSATPDSQGLTPGGEEAGLYECFTLGLERLEAGLVGGAFAWPSTQPPPDGEGESDDSVGIGGAGQEGLAGGMTAAAMTRWGPAARAVQMGGAASDALFGPIPQKPSAAAAAAAAQGAGADQPQGLALLAGMAADEEHEAVADESAAEGSSSAPPEAPQPHAAASRASSVKGGGLRGETEEEGEDDGVAGSGTRGGGGSGHHAGLADLLRQLALHRAAMAALQDRGSGSTGPADADEAPPELVPLLSRFGVSAALQVATAPHPRLPAVRTRVDASPLVFRFSPWRFHRLMAVINSLVASLSSGSDSGSGGAGGAKAAAAQARLPLWVTDAEYTAPVQLLVWEGVGGRVAKWQPRNLVVWRGRVYLSRSPGDGVASESRSYWHGWRLVELPPEEVGGAECAVALVPEGVRREAAAEAPEGLVLRLPEARQVAELRRNMMRSAALVEAVAGYIAADADADSPDSPNAKATSAGVTGTGSGGGSGSVGVTRDLLDELLAHRDVFQLSGRLPALTLKLSGRPPRAWRAVRRLAAAEPPPVAGAAPPGGGGEGVGPAAEVLGNMYAQQQGPESHAGTDAEGRGPLGTTTGTGTGTGTGGGSTSSLSEAGPPSAPASVLSAPGSASAQARAARSSRLAGGQLPPRPPPSVAWGPEGTGDIGTEGRPEPSGEGDQEVDDEEGDEAFEDADDYMDQEDSSDGDPEEEGDEEADDQTSRGAASRQQGHGRRGRSAAAALEALRQLSLDQETPLLSVALAEADVAMQYSADRLAVGLTMQALRMEDELMGAALGRQFAVMALSSSSSSGEAAAGEAAAAAPPAESLATSALWNWQPVPVTAAGLDKGCGVGAGAVAKAAGGPLAQVSFISNSSSSDRYKGLDTELGLRLAGLTLMCHRPTIAALMGLGSDMGYATALLSADNSQGQSQSQPPPPPQPQPQTPQHQASAAPSLPAPADSSASASRPASSAAASRGGASAGAGSGPGGDGPVRAGGDGRTLLQLHISMSRLQLVMPYEVLSAQTEQQVAGATAVQQQQQQLVLAPRQFAQAAVDNFSFRLDVRPSSLELSTSLGNFTAQYGALPAYSPYRTICSLRPGSSTGSLIEVVFRMHSAAEAAAEPRVPPGAAYSSLVARLSAVQVVYLGRFLTELLAYINGLLSMQPRSRPPLSSATSSTPAAAPGVPGSGVSAQAAAPASPATTPFVLLMDVEAAAPVITLPQSSGAAQYLTADLGHLVLRNTVGWKHCGGAAAVGAGAAGWPSRGSVPAVSDATGAGVRPLPMVSGGGAPPSPADNSGSGSSNTSSGGWRVLMDEMVVRLRDMSLVVGAGGGAAPGQNIIRDVGPSGLGLTLYRPLALSGGSDGGSSDGGSSDQPANSSSSSSNSSQPPPMPPLHAAVSIPRLGAVISELEYRRLLAVLAGNFSEPPVNDPRVLELQQLLTRIAAAAAAVPTTAPARPTGDSTPAPSPNAAAQDKNQEQEQQQHMQQQAPLGTKPMPGKSSAGGSGSAGGGSAAATAAQHSSSLPPSRRPVFLDFNRSIRSVLEALQDTCTLEATVSLGSARLTLLVEATDGSGRLLPLATLSMADLWLGYYATYRGAMCLSLALPTLQIEDLRPTVAPELRLVLSTRSAAAAALAAGGVVSSAALAEAAGSNGMTGPSPSQLPQPNPSLLTLEYRSVPAGVMPPMPPASSQPTAAPKHGGPPAAAGGAPPDPAAATAGTGLVDCAPAATALRLRLQRPTLVVDFNGLLLRLVNFVAPSPVFQGPAPRPFETRDLLLSPSAPFLAQGRDLWLSPEVRLLADAPPAAFAGPQGGAAAADVGSGSTGGPTTYPGFSSGGGHIHVYDGGGGRLVLPPALPPSEFLPLIVVGAGRALQLRNVRIVNCASLPSVLQLGAGARLVAREEDGVKMLLAAPDADREYAAVLAAAAAAAEAAAAAAAVAASSGSSATASAPTAGAKALTAGPRAPPPIFEVAVEALGAAVHMVGSDGAVDGSGASGGGMGLSPAAAVGASAGAGGYNAALSTALGQTVGSGSLATGTGAAGAGGGASGAGPVTKTVLNRSTTDLAATSAGAGDSGDGIGAGAGPGPAFGGLGSAAAAAAILSSQRLRRRLVIQLDVSATYRAAGSEQAAAAQLRGLSMRTLTTFGGGPETGSSGLVRPTVAGVGGRHMPPGSAPLSKAASSAALVPDATLGAAAAAPQPSPSPRAPALQSLEHHHRSASLNMTATGTVLPAGATGAGASASLAVGGGVVACVSAMLLEPTDVSLRFSSTSVSTDLSVDCSSLSLRMSPAGLHLLMQLNAGAASQLAVARPDQPLARCDRFERMWGSHDSRAAGSGGGGVPLRLELGVGGVDAMASERGVTVWRPQPPLGYVALGDVLAAGSHQPPNQVATVAINSGLVAFPLGFTRVWASAPARASATSHSVPPAPCTASAPGPMNSHSSTDLDAPSEEEPELCVWRPVPPPGYVALGCVVGYGASPPAPGVVGCVAAAAAVESRLGELLLLGEGGGGNWWRVQNAACTFEVSGAPEGSAAGSGGAGGYLPAVPIFDLRSPLGVPPAALVPLPQLLPFPFPGLIATDHLGRLVGSGASVGIPTALSAVLLPAQCGGGGGSALAGATPGGAAGGLANVARPGPAAVPPVVPLGLMRQGSVPLGVVTGSAPPLSLLCQQRYLRSRRSQISHAVTQASQVPCVEFKRIWWDKNLAGAGPAAPSQPHSHLSIWRPRPPAGYVFLGDTAVTGIYAPPPSVVVLRDSDPAAALTDGRPPPLARPINYVRVWHDEHRERLGEESYLVLWRPVPPAGYVPLGLVARVGPAPPEPALPIRCVRADLVTADELQRASPDWFVPAHKQRLPLCGWLTDRRTGTFTVIVPMPGAAGGAAAAEGGGPRAASAGSMGSSGGGAMLQVYRMKLDADEDSATSRTQPPSTPSGSVAGKVQDGAQSTSDPHSLPPVSTNLELRLGRAAVTLRTSLGRPLLELDVREARLGLCTQGPDVSRGFAFLQLSAWTHSPTLGVWEPLLEPWQLLAHVDLNRASRPRGGVGPGTWVRFTSTQGSVHVALAASALRSLLDAMPEWTSLTGPEGTATVRRQLAFGEAPASALGGLAGSGGAGGPALQQGLVTNALGCEVALLTDLGDRQAVSELAPDAEGVPVLLAPPPAASAAAAAAAESRATNLAPPPVPAIRLLADAVAANGLSPELLAAGALMVRIKVNGPAAELMPETAWGLYTRAVETVPPPPLPAPAADDLEAASTCDTPRASATAAPAAPGSEVVWNERFVLKLPVELSEQLLCPAPGDNQFAGVPLQLDVSLLACGSAGGPPRVVAAGTLPLQSDWLTNEVDILRNTAAAAVAAATAAGMAAPLLSEGGVINSASGGSGAGAIKPPQPSSVSELLDVPLYLVTVQSGSSRQPRTQHQQQKGSGKGCGPQESMVLKLRLSLDVQQVDSSWAPFLSKARRGRAGAGGSAASAALSGAGGASSAVAAAAAARGGRRAIRLAGSDVWIPFSQTGGIITAGPGGDTLQASNTVPIRAGPGLVLERTPGPGGQPLELLRSLAVLHNCTSVPLEVALMAGDPEVASWMLLADTPTSTSAGPGPGSQPGRGAAASKGSRGGPAAAAAPAPPAGSLAPVEEEVYENQRYMPLRGWGAGNLLPTERKRYSRSGHSYSTFPLVPLPPGWEWEGPWQVETAGHVDRDGWFYALDWPMLRYPPTPEQARRKVTDLVRRRRWMRRRRWVGLAGRGKVDGAARRLLGTVGPGERLPLPLGWEAEGVELQVRPVLELAAETMELLVPPQHPASAGPTGGDMGAGAGGGGPDVTAAEARAVHEWSCGPTGQSGLLMTSMDEGGARLLCCRTTAAPPQAAAEGAGPMQAGAVGPAAAAAAAAAAGGAGPSASSIAASAFADLATMAPLSADMAMAAAGQGQGQGALGAVDPAQPAWLSVSLECEALVATRLGLTAAEGGSALGGLDTLVDWRLVVRPPLTLHNTLPVAGRYVVWERPRTGGPLRVRQQGRVPAGATAPVYSADMRMQVFLSFAPDGCEYGEAEPVLLSDGFMRNTAGVSASPRLPDGFRCTYTHSASFIPLRINLIRDVDTSAASGPLASLSVAARNPGTAAGTTTAGAALSPGEAVAGGYPLTVSLHVPLWFVNASQLPVSCGVMALAVEPEPGGPTRSEDSAMGLPRFGPAANDQFLRIVDTEAFRNSPRPNAAVSVLPRSLELLSYPPGLPNSLIYGPPPGEEGGAAGVQVAILLSVNGSRWTQPIYLPRPGEQAQPSKRGVGGVLLPNDRMIIRALAKDGCIHEVALRLEPAPLSMVAAAGAGPGPGAGAAAGATLVRLDHHLVLANSCGYPLQLLQPDAAAAERERDRAHSSQTRSYGSSSVAAQRPGGGPARNTTAATSVGLTSALTLPLPPGVLGSPVHWAAAAAGRRKFCLALPLTGETAASASAYGLPASVMWSEPIKVDLPGGQDTQVPIPVYCLGPVGRYHSAHSSSPAAGAMATMAALANMTPQQQRAFELQRAHVVARQMFAALVGAEAAGTGAGSSMDRAGSTGKGPQAQGSGGAGMLLGPGVGPGLALLSQGSDRKDTRKEHPGGGDEQHAGAARGPPRPALEPNLVRLVKSTDIGSVEFLAVLLNVRVAVRAPGCLVLWAASLGGMPQQLLTNASPLPLMWRQSHPRAAWARVEPYSAVSVCRGVLGEGWGSPPDVEVRDTEPQSESTLLLTFDTTSTAAASTGPPSWRSAGVTGPLGAGTMGDSGRPVLAGMLRVGANHRELLAQVAPALELVLTPDGLNNLPGGGAANQGLGACRLDAALRIAPAPPPIGPAGAGPRAPAFAGPYLTPAALAGLSRSNRGAGAGAGGAATAGGVGLNSSVHLSLEVGSLELSLIDGRPEEIAVLTLDGLGVEVSTGRSAGSYDFWELGLKVRGIQLDDQTPGSAYPVVLQPLDASAAAAAARAGGGECMFALSYCCQPGKMRYALNCPIIAARLLPLRVSLAEPLVWRLYGLALSLAPPAPAAPAQAAQARGGGRHQVSASEMPLAIDLMWVEDLSVRLSFRTDASSRPRWASGGFIRMGLDLAQLEDLALVLPGIELERVKMPRSLLLQQVFTRLQDRLFSIVLAVLRNYGVVGGLSKVLAVSSQAAATLAADGGGGGSNRGGAVGGAAGGGGAGAPSGGGEVRNLGAGVVEGGRAIARGFLQGAMGIITKPVEGAEQGGVAGFFEGLAKGIVAAPVSVVSGTLAAASKVTEGVDATTRNLRGAAATAVGAKKQGVSRKRLQRAFTGDNILRPFSLHPALGQALLYSVAVWLGGPKPGGSTAGGKGAAAQFAASPSMSAGSGRSIIGSAISSTIHSTIGALPVPGLSMSGRAGGRPDLRLDRYEEHWVLPGSVVLMITDRRVLAMQAPEFVALQTAVLSGDTTHVTDVPVGDAVVLWHLPWPDMLSAELAWHNRSQATAGASTPGRSAASAAAASVAAANPPASGAAVAMPADGLLLHRKYRAEDEQLLYDVRCRPGSSQAAEVLSRLQEVRYRCYVLARQQERGWRDNQAAIGVSAAASASGHPTAGPSATGGGGGGNILPDTMISQEFKLVWRSPSNRLTSSRAVSFWRPLGPPGYTALGDVVVLGRDPPPRPVRMYKDAPALAAAAVNASGSGDAPASEGPRLATPVGWTLVFRDSSQPALTLWRPVAPRGYVEMGCIAWPEVEEPPLGLVRCLRRDLAAPGRAFESAIWSAASSDNSFWRASVWQVDAAASTFVAVKGDAKPASALVREAVF